MLILAMAALAAQVSPAPTLATELQPLAFLVGSCWRATFPNGTSHDTHCYTAMPGGRQIRDVHVVEGGPAPYSGESIYRWDPQAHRIRFDYYASDGGHSSGTAIPTATGMVWRASRSPCTKSSSSAVGRLSTQSQPMSSSASRTVDLPAPDIPVTSSRRGLGR